jgi:hypothetical protein
MREVKEVLPVRSPRFQVHRWLGATVAQVQYFGVHGMTEEPAPAPKMDALTIFFRRNGTKPIHDRLGTMLGADT